ncbi:MAG TPA: GNAT family N-acetyltransferase [Sphingobacterium sp.]|nr:GNAT family N-acetyltransferase [Sphingobacterium sp.]
MIQEDINYTIQQASIADADIIHHLGRQVYYATYSEILSREQIDFMLGKNYIPAALVDAMRVGQDFFILYNSYNEALGFISLQNKEQHILRIEKLYLLPDQQSKGLGRQLVEFAATHAANRQRSILELNVNRNNKAYYFYLKQGFHVIAEVDIPYHGFVLDDYVMQKVVAHLPV